MRLENCARMLYGQVQQCFRAYCFWAGGASGAGPGDAAHSTADPWLSKVVRTVEIPSPPFQATAKCHYDPFWEQPDS